MSELSSPATPFEEFHALAVVFGRSRAALDEILEHGHADASTVAWLTDRTLPHIEGVEAGFRAQLRASDGDLPEMRGLVARGGLRLPDPRDEAESRAALIEAMQALAGAGGPRRVVPAQGRDIAALEHARLAMALVPRTPPVDVHFPGRPSYADIAPPRSPGEFVARMEEVERTVWRAASGRRPRRSDPSWRRTYAFFDAGEWLSGGGLLHA